jgi:hypothetical protein
MSREEELEQKYASLFPHLNEQGYRTIGAAIPFNTCNK